jgi:hypothetical protein
MTKKNPAASANSASGGISSDCSINRQMRATVAAF